MIVMGLDLSTKSGVCVVESGKRILYDREIEFPKTTGWLRIYEIVCAIKDIIEKYKPDHIIIEQGFVGAHASAILLAQINAIVRFYLWQDDIEYTDVPATTLKKWLTGSGAAKKEGMMMEVYKQFGHESKTNNIADATALAMFGLCKFSGVGFSLAQIEATKPVPKKTKARKKAE